MTLTRKKTVLLLFLFIISFPPFLSAESKRLDCRVKYDAQKAVLFEHLEDLETTFARYRWIEEKIRWLYYEQLWKARYDSSDPFSKSVRAEARLMEDELHADLETLQDQSDDASNLLNELVQKIQSFNQRFHACCAEYHYESCITGAHKPLYDLMTLVDKDFVHLFEREREYRTVVAETAAGPKGLYPEDALDLSDEHEDYFWRFEVDRHKARFLENTRMFDYFHSAYRLLEWNGGLDGCCYRCGLTQEEIEGLDEKHI